MAEAILEKLSVKGRLAIEADTGVGKTIAYLVPAILSGVDIIISTATRPLQAQLFYNELLPLLRQTGIQLEAFLLKGRENYLCPYYQEDMITHRYFEGEKWERDFLSVVSWSGKTKTGDIGEVAGVAENSPVWKYVTIRENICLGRDCPCLDACYFKKAREQAAKAQVIVVNHYLLVSDVVLANQGLGELLPRANAVIVDEAHRLPQIATRQLSLVANNADFIRRCRAATSAVKQEAGDMRQLLDELQALEGCWTRLVREMTSGQGSHDYPVTYVPVGEEVYKPFLQRLLRVTKIFEVAAPRSKSLEQQCRGFQRITKKFSVMIHNVSKRSCYLDVSNAGAALFIAEPDAGVQFADLVKRKSSCWIFVSATLTVNHSFDYFLHQMQLGVIDTLRIEGSLNHSQQAQLLVPRNFPEPSGEKHTRAVAEYILHLSRSVCGGMLCLFTSVRALTEAARYLQGKTQRRVLVQGDESKQVLLKLFRESGDGILLGTFGFWEGIDIKGDALSCLVIDKLPFRYPGEWMQHSQIESIQRRGGNAFREYQLPDAVISLKQGLGRLLRTESDKGLAVLCDNRILNKNYGPLFLKSLPPIPVIENVSEVDERLIGPSVP